MGRNDTNLQPWFTPENAPETMEEMTWPPVMKIVLTTVIRPLSSTGETSLRYTGTAIDANPAGVVLLASVVV